MKRFRYIVYYERDRDDWRDGIIEANTLEEALSKTWYSFRLTPWTPLRVDELPDAS